MALLKDLPCVLHHAQFDLFLDQGFPILHHPGQFDLEPPVFDHAARDSVKSLRQLFDVWYFLFEDCFELFHDLLPFSHYTLMKPELKIRSILGKHRIRFYHIL